jgi:hypothetical protein
MRQNSDDSGSRKYVVVQLPETTPADSEALKAGYKTIAELTKERLRRAGKKIKAENPLFAGDLGFRVFKLDSTNIREWDPNRENLAESLEASVEHLKTDRTEQDILFELLLKLGLDLCVPIETKAIDPQMTQISADKNGTSEHLRSSATSADNSSSLTAHGITGDPQMTQISAENKATSEHLHSSAASADNSPSLTAHGITGDPQMTHISAENKATPEHLHSSATSADNSPSHTVHSIGGGSLMVCLSTAIPQADAEPLALGLVAWHRELKPAGETTVVFRDSAFADDVAKTNLAAILQQHGLENVRSI